MRDEEGNSRGYGYIQFENKEAATLCLSSPNLVIKTHQVEVCAFKKRCTREFKDNNLYIKNIPKT